MERPEHESTAVHLKGSYLLWEIPTPPTRLYFGHRTRARADLHYQGQPSRGIYTYLGAADGYAGGDVPSAPQKGQWHATRGFPSIDTNGLRRVHPFLLNGH